MSERCLHGDPIVRLRRIFAAMRRTGPGLGLALCSLLWIFVPRNASAMSAFFSYLGSAGRRDERLIDLEFDRRCPFAANDSGGIACFQDKQATESRP